MAPGVGVAARLLALLLVAALLSSCTTSLQRVLPRDVRAGDRVRVTRTDGTVETLQVAAVADDTLRGNGGEVVAVHDIREVAVVTREVPQSTLKAAVTLLAVVAFVGAWALLIWGSERGYVQGP
jgi:hypothetical protein